MIKPEILDFCDRVLEKQNGNPTKNATNILAITAVKTGVVCMGEYSLKTIWSMILKWIFILLYENALTQEDESWGIVIKKIKE